MAKLVGLAPANGGDTWRKWEDSAGPSGPVATLMSICGSPAILSVRHRTCCGVMCLPAIARHTHARRQHRARNPRSAPRSRNASPRNTFLERRKELETNRLYPPQNYAIELAAEISEFTKKEGHAKKFDYHLLAVVEIGAGLKVALLSTPPAQAVPAFKSKGLDIQQMQQNITNLPVQKIHDMTFVFSAD